MTLSHARQPQAQAVSMKGPVRAPIDYLDPRLPAGLRRVPIPVVDATSESLLPYGRLIADPQECRIEIVRWPSTGSRPAGEAMMPVVVRSRSAVWLMLTVFPATAVLW